MLKTCIFMETEQYTNILEEIFGPKIRVDFSMDGIWVGYDYDEYNETTEEPDVEAKLAEYFGVSEVTSIHVDDCDEIGVWICYKE